MSSSPVDSATARPGGADRVPDPRAGAADPSAGALQHAVVPKVGGMPVEAVAAAAALGVHLTAVGGAMEQVAREDTHPVEGVTAVPGRPVRRRNEGVPA